MICLPSCRWSPVISKSVPTHRVLPGCCLSSSVGEVGRGWGRGSLLPLSESTPPRVAVGDEWSHYSLTGLQFAGGPLLCIRGGGGFCWNNRRGIKLIMLIQYWSYPAYRVTTSLSLSVCLCVCMCVSNNEFPFCFQLCFPLQGVQT